MKELELKYGCNPNQKPSRIYMADGSELPIEVLNGRPGYINFLEAAGKRIKESNRTSCCNFFQTRITCGSICRTSNV